MTGTSPPPVAGVRRHNFDTLQLHGYVTARLGSLLARREGALLIAAPRFGVCFLASLEGSM